MQNVHLGGVILHYFIFENAPDDVIYSIDKVCIMGDIEYRYIETFSDNFSWALVSDFGLSSEHVKPWLSVYCKDYKNYTKYGVGDYKNNFNFELSNDSSFYVGYHHNSNKIGNYSWKIELNPNKCLPCEFVDKLIQFFKARSKLNSIKISQADIAIDFKLPRKNFYLEKDKRIYSTCNDGADNITEYLSRHNSNGFCKLYNKTVESNLEYELTRFEITLHDFSHANVCSVFPKIHYYDYSQISFKDTLPKLSQNDEIFVELLRLHPEKFQYLSRRKKQTFRPYLNYDCPIYELDYDTYQKLIVNMYHYFII